MRKFYQFWKKIVSQSEYGLPLGKISNEKKNKTKTENKTKTLNSVGKLDSVKVFSLFPIQINLFLERPVLCAYEVYLFLPT